VAAIGIGYAMGPLHSSGRQMTGWEQTAPQEGLLVLTIQEQDLVSRPCTDFDTDFTAPHPARPAGSISCHRFRQVLSDIKDSSNRGSKSFLCRQQSNEL